VLSLLRVVIDEVYACEVAGLAYFYGGCRGRPPPLNGQFLTVTAVDEQGGCPTFPKLTTLRGGMLVELPRYPGEMPGCPPTTQPRHQPVNGARL